MQFSFCVALYRALFGQAPFEGGNLRQLARAVTKGELREPPLDVRVPARLRAAIVRGLSQNAEDRFPDLDGLIAELVGSLRSRRRRVFRVWMGASAVLAVGASVYAAATPAARPPDPCPRASERFEGVWDAARAAEIQARFEGTGARFAEDTFTRVTALLDRYRERWLDMHGDACAATRVRGEQSEALLDLRMACLGQRHTELSALLDVFAEADEAGVSEAVEAATRLTPLRRCADGEYLSARVPPPEDPEAERVVADLRGDLIRVKVLGDAGKYDRALAELERVRGAAAAVEYAPLDAEIGYRNGDLLEETGDYAGAEQRLADAFFSAQAASDDALATHAAIDLVFVVAYRNARVDDGLTWGRHARAGLSRLGGDALEEARLLHNLAIAHEAAGDMQRASELAGSALEMREQELGSEDPRIASSLHNVGALMADLGDLDGAEATHRRALEIRQRVLGPTHPKVATSYNNVGAVFYLRRDWANAELEFRRALETIQLAHGDEHPEVATYLQNLAIILELEGELDEAEQTLRRAAAIFEKVHGRRHSEVASCLQALAKVKQLQGDHDAAEVLVVEALDTLTAIHGAEHHRVATALVDLAALQATRGHYRRALENAARALAIRERVFGAGNPSLLDPLGLQAYAHAALGDREASGVAFARGSKIFEQLETGGGKGSSAMRFELYRGETRLVLGEDLEKTDVELTRFVAEVGEDERRFRGRARFLLARVKQRLGAPAAELRALASQAREDLEADGGFDTVLELDAWLATLPPSP